MFLLFVCFFHQLFFHTWAISPQFNKYARAYLLNYDNIGGLHGQANLNIMYTDTKRKENGVPSIKHKHTLLNPLVSSADVYIPSSQYSTDELIASEAPSLPLISIISPHTHSKTARRECACTNPIISPYLPVCRESDRPGLHSATFRRQIWSLRDTFRDRLSFVLGDYTNGHKRASIFKRVNTEICNIN